LFQKRLLGLLVGTAIIAGCGGGGVSAPAPIGQPSPAPSSDRPNESGLQAQYVGTLTENDTNNLIGASPVSMITTSAATMSVTVATSGTSSVFTSTESDAGALSTLTTTTTATIAYNAQANGTTQLQASKVVATDSNGNTYETDYGPGNGLLDVIPEANGTFANTAQESYKESDVGISSAVAAAGVNCPSAGTPVTVSTDREVNVDGSYTQCNGALSSADTWVDDVAIEAGPLSTPVAPAFSGSLVLNALAGGRTFTFSAPAAASIGYTYYNGASHTTTPSTVPDWIPATLTQPSVETDAIATGQALDPSCATTFGTVANKVTQTIKTADAILGTLETKTTATYDIFGPGTVCTVVSDTLETFYDFSDQEGGAPRLYPSDSATVPAETITISETLSLSSTTPPAGKARAAASLGGSLVLPRSIALAHVEHLVRQKALQLRTAALRSRGGISK
jgi:hypothetical protein